MKIRRILSTATLLCATLSIQSQALAAIVTLGDVSLQPSHDWVRVAAANPGETGTLEVNGGSVLVSQGSAPVPLPPTNILEPGGMVGRFNGSFGTATVTGTGSTWRLEGIGTDGPAPGDVTSIFGPYLLVGRDGGRGELNVTSGGKIILDGLGADYGASSGAGIIIGRDLSSGGGGSVLNIDGPGSEVILDNIDHTNFRMGNGEASFVNITNQGNLNIAGDNSNAQLQWGEFNVNTGGTATTNLALVGNRQNSDVNVNIDGPTSSMHLTGVGTADNGHGNAGFGGFMTIGRGQGSTAVVNLTNGANLIIDSGTGFAADGTASGGSGFSLGGSTSSSSGQGTLIVSSNSQVTVSGGGEFVGIGRSETGTGIINIDSGGQVLIENNVNSFGVFMASSQFSGTAELNVDGATSLFDAGKSLNVGVYDLPKIDVLNNNYTAQADVKLSNGGVVRADEVFVGAGGKIGGNGTLDGNVMVSTGTVAPGLSPGILTIDGNFEMTDGLLEIEIAGLGAGQFDILNILGTGNLTGGTILFSFLDGFLPQATDPVLDFLFADNLTIGPDVAFDFQGVDDSFELSVAMLDGANGGKFLRFDALNDALPLSQSAVPVPAAIWLFGTALIGLLGLGKRRQMA